MKLSRRIGRLPKRKDWGMAVCVCMCVRDREATGPETGKRWRATNLGGVKDTGRLRDKTVR